MKVLRSQCFSFLVLAGHVCIVAEVGLEPTRPLRTRDFKSRASAIPPLGHAV